jgi:hypothetical protein
MTDHGVLESLSTEPPVAAELQHAVAELRMFLAHYKVTKADAEIPLRINFHNGVILALWVGNRRFELDPKKLRN